MNTTAQSEVGKITSLLIKHPIDAFIDDNHISKQWEELNYLSPPIFSKAKVEYQLFEKILLDESIHIEKLPSSNDVMMDSIYCRDAAIATDGGMIICRMGKEGRINEPVEEKKIFNELGLSILGEIETPGTLEGGDVAWIDEKTLAVGHTYRTNESGILQLRSLLESINVELIVAEMPHYKGENDVFHLMSIFSPVADDLAVVYSPLMPIKFRNELIKRGFKLVEVPDEEFESMGCNVLALSPRKCLMVKGNLKTKQMLEIAGCQVIEYEGEEISVKGGGGPTCLTRPITRQRTN